MHPAFASNTTPHPGGKRGTLLSKNHATTTMHTMNNLRQQREFCDVVLKVGGLRINASRQVLSACSPYFYTMFLSEFAESNKEEVELKDLDENVVESIVDFCYTGEMNIGPENVQSFLHASSLLQMDTLMEQCCKVLSEQISSENAFDVSALAVTYNCQQLQTLASRFVTHYFEELVQSEDFLNLSPDRLTEILSRDDLNTPSEEIVYKAVLQWVEHNKTERSPLFSSILKCVRLPLCNPRFLVETVGENPLIKSEHSSRDLVDEAKNFLLISKLEAESEIEEPKEKRLKESSAQNTNDDSETPETSQQSLQIVQNPRTKPRRPYCNREFVYAVGGWANKVGYTTKVELMNHRTGKWKPAKDMSTARAYLGVAYLEPHLYAIGGFNGPNYFDNVERYSPGTDTWDSSVAPMSKERSSLGVATLGGYIYAVGGFDGTNPLDLVERYDKTTNTWRKMAPMNTKRGCVAVSVLEGYLYAVGGKDGDNILHTVEKYDPKEDKWTRVPSMSTKRWMLGCVTYNGCLYAIGGWNEKRSWLSSVEKYNPVTNYWVTVAPLKSPRWRMGAGVANGKLFCVGGRNNIFLGGRNAVFMGGNNSTLKDDHTTVEVYDGKKWEYTGTLSLDRNGLQLGVVPFQASNCPCLDD